MLALEVGQRTRHIKPGCVHKTTELRCRGDVWQPCSLTTGSADTLLSTNMARASYTDADSWTVAICLKVPIASSPICLWRNLGLGIIDPWSEQYLCQSNVEITQTNSCRMKGITLCNFDPLWGPEMIKQILQICGGTWGCVCEWGCGGRFLMPGRWPGADVSYSSTRSRWRQTNWGDNKAHDSVLMWTQLRFVTACWNIMYEQKVLSSIESQEWSVCVITLIFQKRETNVLV